MAVPIFCFGVSMIRTKCYSVGFKVLISFFALLGISLQTGLYKGNFDIGVFRMFTNISNLLCAVYFIFAASFIAFDKRRTGGASPCPLIKGVCTMSITLTGIVGSAAIVGEFSLSTSAGIATILLHIITPVMIMADWLLFDIKGRYKGFFPLVWLSAPFAYFIYIMVSAQFMEKGARMRFPYPFLDYEILGIPALITVVAIITVFYGFIGYLCYFIDKKMSYLEKITT